jgi:hypothetical protein
MALFAAPDRCAECFELLDRGRQAVGELGHAAGLVAPERKRLAATSLIH